MSGKFILPCCRLIAMLLLALPAVHGQVNMVISDGSFEFSSETEDAGDTFGLTPPLPDGRLAPMREELDRYLRYQKWAEAFSVLASINDLPAAGFSQHQGIFRPWREAVLLQLLDLPPEGRQAYRLFNDPQAEAAEKALGPGISTADLDAGAIRWFLSEAGGRLADRAAVASYRDGAFLRAAWWWRMLRKHHPGNAQTEANRMLRQIMAIYRAGETEAAAALIAEAATYLDVTVSIGDKEMPLRQALPKLPKITEETASAGDFKITEMPIWRHTFLDDNWEDNLDNSNGQMLQVKQVIDSTVPDVMVSGKHVVVGWRHALSGLDIDTGLLSWRQVRLSKIFEPQMSYRFIQPVPGPPPQIIGNYIYSFVHRDEKQLQGRSTISQLDIATGNVTWQSQKETAFRTLRPFSNMIDLGNGQVACAGLIQSAPPQLGLAEIPVKSPKDGKVRILGGLAVPNAMNRNLDAQLQRVGGRFYVAIATGDVAAYDQAQGGLLWINRSSDGIEMGNPYLNRSQMMATPETTSMLLDRSLLIVKFPSGRSISAISQEDGRTVWRRPCLPDTSLISRVGDYFLVAADGGLSALSAETGRLVWHAPLPVSDGTLVPMVTRNHLVVMTNRGIFTLDRKTGARVGMVRGYDIGGTPSGLVRVGSRLLAVSATGITCYSITSENGDTQ